MRLDFKSLAFGYELEIGGGNPAWETALGQGAGYKLKDSDSIDELVKGMIYKAVSSKTISFKKGKGGKFVNGDADDSGLVIASVFDKVFINDKEILNGKFILLISKDDSQSHNGRLKLKYGIDNTYKVDDDTVIKNQDFIDLVKTQLGLANDACWFVYDISVENQDTLRLRTIIVNKDKSMTYADSKALHSAWDSLMDDELPTEEKVTDKKGENILLYGVPGCGKSHEIKTKYCDNGDYRERVVFHPDYTYSDFIGQILPKTEGDKISYPFMPGPFTKILEKAYSDPYNMYYLVIEEINRGNAPAIFGEVFQLLDREDGESEYGITNFDIAKHIYGEGNEETEIKIPRNLTILATMNTADQNVFTLDTAFKRRWSMRSIKNDIPGCNHAGTYIAGTQVTWQEFAEKINETIIDVNEGNLSSEDNRLGAYFVKEDDLLSRKTFAEKVLMYLWNDAFKYDRDKIFKSEYKTLEKLLDAFCDKGFAVFNSQLGFNEVLEVAASKLDESEYLQNKKGELVKLYSGILDLVKVKIPNLYTYTTPSKQYIGIGSDDNSKKSFAEAIFKTGLICFEIEKPTQASLQILGTEIERNGSHDHYFKIEVTETSNFALVVDAIVDSYEQLKKDN